MKQKQQKLKLPLFLLMLPIRDSFTGFLTQLDGLIADGKTNEARDKIVQFKESIRC